MSELLQAWIATFVVTASLAVPFFVLAFISVRRGIRREAADDGIDNLPDRYG